MKAAGRHSRGPFPRCRIRIGRDCTPNSNPWKREALSVWKKIAFCALAMTISAAPFYAQKGGGSPGGIENGGPGSGASLPCTPDGYHCSGVVPEWKGSEQMPPIPNPAVVEDDRCLPWTLSEGRSTGVDVTRLKVPSKAKREYEKACDANHKKDLDQAEQHARSALSEFQNYAPAWVLLGLILDQQDKGSEANDACAHAVTADATYLPGYLCEAELAAKNLGWDQSLKMATLGLGLNSVGDGYVNYYRASAYLHKNELDDAKKSALQAEKIDAKRIETPLDFLLAQIYDAQGDRANAEVQLRKILKRHNDPQQESAAKEFLARLESQQNMQ
jgi:tetratricopeptide (TPR) repeat protein